LIQKTKLMSYSIFYDKQFIKVGDNLFIPMIEGGDNNVYEAAGNGRRRARDWYNNRWVTNGKIYASKEEIESRIDNVRAERIKSSVENVKQFNDESWSYDDKRFGWHEGVAIYGKHTSNTSFGNFKGFFMKGCDEAMTIEELLKYSIGVRITLPYYVKDKLTEKNKEVKNDVYPKTTEELLNTIKEWEEYYGNDFYIDYRNTWGLKNIKRERKKDKPTKEKQWIETNVFYALECASGYFVKNLKRGYRYAYTSTSAKKFIDEKSAIKFHNKMKNKDLFSIKRFENQYTVSVLT